MGVSQSKISENRKSIPLSNPNTANPISTSQSKIIDPRSPSIEIARTPIEIMPISASKIEQLFKETKDVEVSSNTFKCLYNKNEDNIRRKLLKDATLKNLIKTSVNDEFKEINSYNNEELLGSESSISPGNSYSQARIGVLETNIDFIETDIDVVLKNKNLRTNNDMLLTPRQILRDKFAKNHEDTFKIDSDNIVQLDDPRSPTVGIDRTPIQFYKGVNNDTVSPMVDSQDQLTPVPALRKKEFDTLSKVSPKLFENIEYFQQKLDSLCISDTINDKIENLNSLNDSLKENTLEEKTPKINSNIRGKEQLIYEDQEEDVELSKNNTAAESSQRTGRTPLSIRNGNSQIRSKSASGRLNNTQTVKSLKKDYTVNKIPVFHKDVKKIRGKIQANENTPPNSKNVRVVKSQWDFADSTMII